MGRGREWKAKLSELVNKIPFSPKNPTSFDSSSKGNARGWGCSLAGKVPARMYTKFDP